MTPTFDVDVTIRGTDPSSKQATMNYTHNATAVQAASAATLAIADYSEEPTTPEPFRTELVSLTVTPHNASTCRYCNKEN